MADWLAEPALTRFATTFYRDLLRNGRLAGGAGPGQICDYFLLGIYSEMADWLAVPALVKFAIITL